jgi:hypothetical protein
MSEATLESGATCYNLWHSFRVIQSCHKKTLLFQETNLLA